MRTRILTMAVAVLVMVLLIGCADWEVLSPNEEGELTVELLDCQITFLYDESSIAILNMSWREALVKVCRRQDDAWGEYTEVIARYVPGRTEIKERAYFRSGDKMKIVVTISGDNNEKISREMYFELG